MRICSEWVEFSFASQNIVHRYIAFKALGNKNMHLEKKQYFYKFKKNIFINLNYAKWEILNLARNFSLTLKAMYITFCGNPLTIVDLYK